MSRPTPQQRARDARIAYNLRQIREQGGTPDDEREYLETVEGLRVGAPVSRGPAAPATPAEPAAEPSWLGGAVRQGAQGLTFGFADEIEGAARALRSGRPYRTERDRVRTETQQFADENPLTSIAANIAGGLVPAIATGGAAGIARGGMGLGSRLIRASALGGAGGAVAGVGNAKEVDDVPRSAGVGALVGAGLGAAGGAAAEAVGKVGRAAAGLIRPQATEMAGRFAKVRAALANRADPERGGAQRVLRTLERAGRSLDDLEGASAVAPEPNALAEVVGPRGVGALRMARNFGRRSDEIDAALAERASGEGSRFYATVARETGLEEPLDPDAFAARALEAARETAGPKYAATQGNAIPPEMAAPVLRDIATLRDDGIDLWRMARAADEQFPKRPPQLPPAPGEPAPVSSEPIRFGASGKARTGSGRLRKVESVDSADLVDELREVYNRIDRDRGMSQYATVESDQAGVMRTVATGTRKDGVSQQAKALHRINQAEGVAARIEAELRRRGIDPVKAMTGAADEGELPPWMLDDAEVERAAIQAADDPGVTANVAERGADPSTLTAGNLQRLRQVLDDKIVYGDAREGLNSIERAAQRRLRALRDRVDELAKAAGGTLFEQADEEMATAFARGESFRSGTQIGQEMTADGIARARASARDPEAFRQGAASQALARIRAASDGEAGTARNPAALAVADPVRRARFREGFTDDDSFERARQAAREATERLRTRNTVSGGSQTARNLLEGANEAADDPEMLVDVARAIASPVSGSVNLATRALRAGGRAAFGDEMDAAGRFLGAGLPSEMTRAEAIRRLREIEPILQRYFAAQAARRGATAAALTGVGTRR